MVATSKRYTKLLQAQNLIKARDEAELETSRRAMNALEEENQYLFSLMQHGSNADFIDPMIVSRRLERNRRLEGALEIKIADEIKTLLQTTRRCEMIEKKKHEAQHAEERKDLAEMLEEYVATRSFKDSSLG